MDPGSTTARTMLGLLRYVDDVELFFDGQVLQVRSCSRLGRRDFGVNRRRVEELRKLIEARR